MTFEMRRYPGDAPEVKVTLDLLLRACTFETPSGSENLSFEQIKERLEEWYWRNRWL